MSFLSGLKVFGQDIEKAFEWFGSPKGQAEIATGEAVVETALPISTPIFDLFNAWVKKAFIVESLAVAAGKATGTGADKAVFVDQAIAPDVIQYAKDAGLPVRSAVQVAALNNAVIAFINAATQTP